VQVLYKKVLYKNLRGSDPIFGSTLNSSWHGATTCLSYYSVVRVYSFLACWSVALLFSSTWPGLYIFKDILTANSYTLVLQAATRELATNGIYHWLVSMAVVYGLCLAHYLQCYVHTGYKGTTKSCLELHPPVIQSRSWKPDQCRSFFRGFRGFCHLI